MMEKLYKVYFMDNGVKRYVQSGMDTEFSEKRARQIVEARRTWKSWQNCFIELVEVER